QGYLSRAWELHILTEALDKHALRIADLRMPPAWDVMQLAIKKLNENPELYGPVPRRPQKPQQGDSLDTWLDWRDTQRKRGRKVRLEDIAAEGEFSINTVKKRSAERKPRGKA